MNLKKILTSIGLVTVVNLTMLNIVNNQENVSIKDNTEQEIVKGINSTSYIIGAWVGTTVEDFKYMIDGNFIKAQLWNDLQQKFRNPLFFLNKVTVNEKELTDEDLATVGEIAVVINYNYGSYKKQNTNLKINKIAIPDITPEQFINIAKERSATNPMEFQIKVFDGNDDYLPQVLEMMTQQIYDEFLNIYKLKINPTKLKMEKIISNNINPKEFSNEWFKKTQRFLAIASGTYDELPTDGIKILFKVAA